jgi:hypothetical protein
MIQFEFIKIFVNFVFFAEEDLRMIHGKKLIKK